MQATTTAKKAWNRLLDSSEPLDHLESVVSFKILRPIREAIYEYREARRIATIDHEVF